MQGTLKDFPEHIFYSDGRIYGKYRKKFLKPNISKQKHLRICLIDRKRIKKNYSVHRLIAQCFIPNPNNYPFVCHKDSDAFNNNIYNLYWGTPQDNMDDRKRLGRYYSQVGENNYCSKLKEKDVKKLKELLLIKKARQIWTENIFPQISLSTIYDIKHGKSWTHLLEINQPQEDTKII